MPHSLEIPTFVKQTSPARPTARRRRLRIPSLRKFGVVVAVSGGLWVVGSAGMRPYVEAHRLSAEEVSVQHAIDLEQRKHAELARAVAELKTPDGIRNAARPFGWVLPGEVPISCPPADTPLSRTSDEDLLKAPADPAPPLLLRLHHALEW